MAKKQTTKRQRTPGERWTIFLTKGNTRNRIRAFPVPNGYRVSVTKRTGDKTTDRSVETFATLADARTHVDSLTKLATGKGWILTIGSRQNNAQLFA